MSLRVDKVSFDDNKYTKTDGVQQQKKKKINSAFTEGQFVAYMPMGGIGSLLNGKGAQPTNTAHSA